MTTVALALIAALAGASGAPGGEHDWVRTEMRAFVGAGTSDLGGLDRFHPALLGGGDAAGRAGVVLQGWWTRRVAFGMRFALASDTGTIPGLGNTYFYRRSLVAETVVTVSALRLGPLDLVATGGVGFAAIFEGADRHYLLEIPGGWGTEMLSVRGRIGPTASVGTGLLLTAGRLSLSALARFETIGGSDFIDGTMAAGTLHSYGLALTGELGVGLAWW